VISRISFSVLNRQKSIIYLRHVRLKRSIKAFCVGLPGWINSSFTAFSTSEVSRLSVAIHNSDHSDTLYKIFDDNPVYVPKGDCLPVFGFKFTSGEHYNFAYDVQSDKSESHLVIAEFSYSKG